VLLLYPYIGLTASAYVAIPVVAPIAMGGFYSFNGMSFYDVVRRKTQFMFFNQALVYSSTECELVLRDYKNELLTQINGNKIKKKHLLLQKNRKKKKKN
ncbi:PrgI family protein, partial [Lachnotalea glycerini]